jgi:hypothetical protein
MNTKRAALKKLYSRLDPTVLLATVFDAHANTRQDAAGAEEILQAAVIPLPQGRVVKSHQHVATARTTTGTAEAWVVMSGVVQAQLFDTNQALLETMTLGCGDCMVLYRGGHNLTVIESAVIFEIKNGPYFGPEQDSVKI